MKIATYNVNSIRQRLQIVLDWLAQHQPDVLCLQETKVQDQDFPVTSAARAVIANTAANNIHTSVFMQAPRL